MKKFTSNECIKIQEHVMIEWSNKFLDKQKL